MLLDLQAVISTDRCKISCLTCKLSSQYLMQILQPVTMSPGWPLQENHASMTQPRPPPCSYKGRTRHSS
jgi:hypothetical protein